MNIKDLQEKQVAVIGYGQEGRATINYLLKHGISPVLFDKEPLQSFTPDDQHQLQQLKINLIMGKDALKELSGFDIAFRSPGVWRLQPELLAAERKGLIVTSQVKWFFEHTPAKIIGVTGTKGKGTTATLIKNIYAAAVKSKVYLTGNIGDIQPLDFLDQLTPLDLVVYELSSFQLQDLDRSPHIAVVLMITTDHLDVHANKDEYHRAKENLVRHQTEADFAIINSDYPISRRFSDLTRAEIYFFSRHSKVGRGSFWEDGTLIIEDGSGEQKALLKADELLLRGQHNWENVSAAVLAAMCGGIKNEIIKEEVSKFSGLEHRLELVNNINGVSYYNDSFSTTPETAIAAIKAFSEPLIVILGGSEKGSDFQTLGQALATATNVKALILIGQTAPKIKQAINKEGKFKRQILEGAADMRQIFQQIESVATAGDVVLLSPASASFDMFPNYKARGHEFKQYVANLRYA